VTFFTTLPPVLKLSPKPDTAWAPNRWSRAPPALIRRGPARPAAIMPPMVPDTGVPSSGAVFIGSKANCWFLASISDSTSASEAPA
jgi:hypothetical protein